MPKRITPKSDLAATVRDLRNAEHDSDLIDEIRVLVGKCLSMLASGLPDEALAYANMTLEAAKGLRTKAAQESVIETLWKLDAILVASGLIPSFEDVTCTMLGAEA